MIGQKVKIIYWKVGVNLKSKTMKYYNITGFWKDTNENFTDRIVVSEDYNETVPDHIDEQIFFYGLDEKNLEASVLSGWDTDLEFVIVEFEETEL